MKLKKKWSLETLRFFLKKYWFNRLNPCIFGICLKLTLKWGICRLSSPIMGDAIEKVACHFTFNNSKCSLKNVKCAQLFYWRKWLNTGCWTYNFDKYLILKLFWRRWRWCQRFSNWISTFWENCHDFQISFVSIFIFRTSVRKKYCC